MQIDLDEIFYRSYPTYFHIYLTTLFKNYLENPSQFQNLFKGIDQIDENAVKLQIRAMYFQSIETLFELIFNIEKIVRGKTKLLGMWANLSNSDWKKNYNRISKENFEYLDQEITINDVEGNRLNVTLGHYLFFFSISLNGEIEHSLKAIKIALRVFAKDFSDRDQYNAFKHSLRAFPALKNITLTGKIKNESHDILKMATTISYLSFDKDIKNKIKLISKALDTRRDIDLLLLSSQIISNLVHTRRSVKLNKSEFIYYFTEQEVNNNSKHNFNLGSFNMDFQT